MSSDQNKNMVAIPADIYEELEKIALEEKRPVETLIAALLASEVLRCKGIRRAERQQEYQQRMGYTKAELQASALERATQIKEQSYQREEATEGTTSEKDNIDAKQ